MTRVYGYARVGRSGLGNMLLPWARCEVFCYLHQIPMLAPQWIQPKIGPILRREKDKRYYFGLFNNSNYIRGPLRWWLLATNKRVDEASAKHLSNETGSYVIEFKGLGNYFADLAGHSEFLHRRLISILSRRSLELLERVSLGNFVAVHIRRGDMPVLTIGSDPPAHSMLWATPTEWYVRCIKQVRQVLGADISVVVFTDAYPEQIADVLTIPGVRLASPTSAVVDLLLMARARILITSASSTFSMWSSFFGQMPSIWFPSGWREQTNWINPHFECYTDKEANLPRSFRELVQ